MECASLAEVCRAWKGASRWVVVYEYYAGGFAFYCLTDDDAVVDYGGVKPSTTDILPVYQVIDFIKVEYPALFVIKMDH